MTFQPGQKQKVVPSKQTWSPEARPVTKSDRWDWRREDQTASSLERLAYQVFLYKCNVATAYLYCSNGSRLCLRVPEKSTGSYTVGETISWQVTDFFGQIATPFFNLVSGETCGMMVSLLLSLCRPNSEMSTPSINIRPEAGSINLTKQSCKQIKLWTGFTWREQEWESSCQRLCVQQCQLFLLPE